MLCLGVAASSDAPDDVRAGRFGSTEVVTMLFLAAVVLGLFVVSQLVALTDAGRRLVESSGLTPAECARGGFFQLCRATALLVVFLGLVRALAAPGVLLVLIAARNLGVGGDRNWSSPAPGPLRWRSCWSPISPTRRRSSPATTSPGRAPAPNSTWATFGAGEQLRQQVDSMGVRCTCRS